MLRFYTTHRLDTALPQGGHPVPNPSRQAIRQDRLQRQAASPLFCGLPPARHPLLTHLSPKRLISGSHADSQGDKDLGFVNHPLPDGAHAVHSN